MSGSRTGIALTLTLLALVPASAHGHRDDPNNPLYMIEVDLVSVEVVSETDFSPGVNVPTVFAFESYLAGHDEDRQYRLGGEIFKSGDTKGTGRDIFSSKDVAVLRHPECRPFSRVHVNMRSSALRNDFPPHGGPLASTAVPGKVLERVRSDIDAWMTEGFELAPVNASATFRHGTVAPQQHVTRTGDWAVTWRMRPRGAQDPRGAAGE